MGALVKGQGSGWPAAGGCFGEPGEVLGEGPREGRGRERGQVVSARAAHLGRVY